MQGKKKFKWFKVIFQKESESWDDEEVVITKSRTGSQMDEEEEEGQGQAEEGSDWQSEERKRRKEVSFFKSCLKLPLVFINQRSVKCKISILKFKVRVFNKLGLDFFRILNLKFRTAIFSCRRKMKYGRKRRIRL